MNKRVLIICSFLVLLIACKKKNVLPKGIFPPAKMQSVLWDMVRTGEFLNSFVIYRDTTGNRAGITEKWNQKVFAVNKVKEQDFIRSYEYYRAHPPLMKEIMDSLTKQKAGLPVVNHPLSTPTPTSDGPKPLAPSFQNFGSNTKDSLLKKKRRIRMTTKVQ